ncbi:TadE family protein [Nocardioides sp. AN3]
MGERRFVVRRTERGAAAVEFALVLVPLLIIVFGLIQYGIYFWAMQGGADIARDAARRAAIVPTCTNFTDTMKSSVDNFVGTNKIQSASATYQQIGTHATATEVKVNDSVTVSVTFKSYDFNFPFVPFIRNGVVSSSATARVENDPSTPLTSLTCSKTW